VNDELLGNDFLVQSRREVLAREWWCGCVVTKDHRPHRKRALVSRIRIAVRVGDKEEPVSCGGRFNILKREAASRERGLGRRTFGEGKRRRENEPLNEAISAKLEQVCVQWIPGEVQL
jgi:hypothetical protein